MCFGTSLVCPGLEESISPLRKDKGTLGGAMKQAGLGRQGVWEAVGRPLTHTPLERLGALQKFPSGGTWPPAHS